MAKEKHKIKITINQNNFLNQPPDLEFLICDGSEQQNQLLISSDMLLMQQTVQTHENYIAKILYVNVQ